MQKKKGISLIVLVITIIVMIILAATIMIALSNNGVLGRAEEAVDVTNIKQVETLAQTAWSEAYLYYKEKAEIATQEKLETKVNEILAKSNINLSKYDIEVTEQGVVVTEKGGSGNAGQQPNEPTLDPALNHSGIIPEGATYTTGRYFDRDAFMWFEDDAVTYNAGGEYIEDTSLQGWNADSPELEDRKTLVSINGQDVVAMHGAHCYSQCDHNNYIVPE